ncbi:MAG: TlpA disulfide reductase family protein [Bryobacterales bacterium]|nr:TlpA disulfide reductase family protein [Bryobacterales bacterium]MDE0629040.1 TlpA disulfide reductase family protein [Bryobacterales bacterium]
MPHRLICAGAALALVGALWGAPRPAQPFEAVSYDGRTVSLDALKGKAAVLMFFSTDCPHCQRTALRIDPIYRSLRERGFEVIGLSLNSTDNAGLREFANRFQASFPLTLSSRSEFSRISGVSVMTRIYYPYLLFLDRDGMIQEEHQGSEQAWFDRVDVNFLQAVERLMP